MIKTRIYFPFTSVIYRNVENSVVAKLVGVLAEAIRAHGIEQQLFLVTSGGNTTSTAIMPFKQVSNSTGELARVLFISWETAGEIDCFLMYVPSFMDTASLAAAIDEEVAPTDPKVIGRLFGGKPTRLSPFSVSLEHFVVRSGGFMLRKDHDGGYIDLIGHGKSSPMYHLLETLGRSAAEIP